MAINSSRSMRGGLLEGSTDGKYRKVRPDTQVAQLTGGDVTVANRAHLHTWFYDLASQEVPEGQKVVPGQ